MSASQKLEIKELRTTSVVDAPTAPLNVYVHIANGYDSLEWQKKWRAGKILGLNEEFPYGYHHAARYGTSVIYSTDHVETGLQKFLRYGFRAIFGFDFFHAWRNRREILRADVVWTHTESQSLAILLLFVISRQPLLPKIIGQVVWLIDEWQRLGHFRKMVYKYLLQKADILTFLSPLNAQVASSLFPDTRVEFVKFGINTNYPKMPRAATDLRKIRVLSVGNDRHRDWSTLVEAIKGVANIELRLLTTTYKLRGKFDNISTIRVDSNEGLLAEYEWADMLVLTLKPNLHASGITVIEESVILGVPVICSRVGGLEAYFPDGDILYIDPLDPEAVRKAIHYLGADEPLRQSLIANSRRRMAEAGISSQGYARRHVELSAELCGPCGAVK